MQLSIIIWYLIDQINTVNNVHNVGVENSKRNNKIEAEKRKEETLN